MKLDVLYEDNHVIAVVKPAGILVQGDASKDPNLMDEVKKYLKEKYQKPGNVFLGLIHRLDRNVSGIILFAKTSKGASRLSEQFRNHDVVKTYHAWVEGIFEQTQATLSHYLLKNEATNTTRVVSETAKGAQYAELSYEVVEVRGAFSLAKIFLKTGRSHQIRVQLSHIGHPIVGDTKYGSKYSLPYQELMLSATSLSFTTATGGEKKTLFIEVPKLSLSV